MVEVYHSASLYCAASHELMMNAGRDGERADCSREAATEGWTGEQRCTVETEIFGWAHLEGRSAPLRMADVQHAANQHLSQLIQLLLRCF